MKKQVPIIIALLLLAAAATWFYYYEEYYKYEHTPPTWGWTKIVDYEISKTYSDGFTKYTTVHVSVNVRKKYEESTLSAYLLKGTSKVAEELIVMTFKSNTFYTTYYYSDQSTSISTTGSFTLKRVDDVINTKISITFIASSGKYYFGTYPGNAIVYTYTYAGYKTWVGTYSTDLHFANADVTAKYKATIIQQ